MISALARAKERAKQEAMPRGLPLSPFYQTMSLAIDDACCRLELWVLMRATRPERRHYERAMAEQDRLNAACADRLRAMAAEFGAH